MLRLALGFGLGTRLQRWALIILALAACTREQRASEPSVESPAHDAASSHERAGAQPAVRDAAVHDAAVGRSPEPRPPAPSDAAPSSAPQPVPAPLPVKPDAAASGEDAGLPPRPGVVGPTLDALMNDYRSWAKRTPEPISISNSIWSLCRLPSLAEQAFADSEHGDGLYLLDWANAEAAQGIAAGGKPGFPVGAAIVKEKLRLEDDGKFAVAALGLMIKRGPGFGPANGDWEFGYWESASGLASGEEPARHCGGCHAGSQTDHVFVDMSWRYPPLQQ